MTMTVQVHEEDSRLAEILTPLPIDLNHALHVYTLPDHHRDPFDRILIAQSQLAQLPILTLDPQIARYEVATIW